MSTAYDQHTPIHDQTRPVVQRPARCLRHRVWMAACGDCRDMHRNPGTGTPRPAAPVA